jgi:hypothetical protein
MFASLLENAGALNTWHHSRQPTELDQQPVIRMNRDTLYSMAIVDISGGATLTLPDTDGRYLSVMGVNQDHYINHVFHEAGTHELTIAMFDTPYLTVAARTLVDPNDPEDVAEVNRIQDQLAIDAASSTPFIVHEYDEASYQATRNAILELARGLSDFTKAFGRKAEVDPIAHLLGTAAGWGGLPITEAMYASVAADLPVDEYKIEVGEVPVDAF